MRVFEASALLCHAFPDAPQAVEEACREAVGCKLRQRNGSFVCKLQREQVAGAVVRCLRERTTRERAELFDGLARPARKASCLPKPGSGIKGYVGENAGDLSAVGHVGAQSGFCLLFREHDAFDAAAVSGSAAKRRPANDRVAVLALVRCPAFEPCGRLPA